MADFCGDPTPVVLCMSAYAYPKAVSFWPYTIVKPGFDRTKRATVARSVTRFFSCRMFPGRRFDAGILAANWRVEGGRSGGIAGDRCGRRGGRGHARGGEADPRRRGIAHSPPEPYAEMGHPGRDRRADPRRRVDLVTRSVPGARRREASRGHETPCQPWRGVKRGFAPRPPRLSHKFNAAAPDYHSLCIGPSASP